MTDTNYTPEELLGPHGRTVVRDTVNMCKNVMGLSEDATINSVAKKFSYDAELRKAAVAYARQIYGSV